MKDKGGEFAHAARLWFYDKLIGVGIKFEKLFLNEPLADRETLLHANYDKLLHILGLFAALLWLNKFINPTISFSIALALCILKTIWNYRIDSLYNPLGDWLANTIGVGLWLFWN